MRVVLGRWRRVCALLAVFVVVAPGFAQERPAPAPGAPDAPAKPSIADATKGFKAIDGLLSPYFQDTEQRLLLTLLKQDLGQEFLAVASVARGQMRRGGLGELLANQIITFRRLGNMLQVVRRDYAVRANPDTPEATAVDLTYNDDVLAVMRLRTEDNERLLVDPTEALLGGVLTGGIPVQIGRGGIESVKAFPANVQFRFSTRVGEDQIELLLELVRLPKDSGFVPREADDRIGYFGRVVEDYSNSGQLSPRTRFINRWKLEKVDPNAPVSDVKEPVVWWIEKTVPREYRSFVREGILEWNKGYERAGYRNAIEVRQQGESDAFDPNDIRYNTFRWALGEQHSYAIAVMTANPKNGQLLCGRVMFHDGLLRSMLPTYVTHRGVPEPEKLRRGYLAGWLQEYGERLAFTDHERVTRPEQIALAVPGSQESESAERCLCKLQSDFLRRQYDLACEFYAQRQNLPPGSKIPLEFSGQFVKAIAMHEVGHCLGLRHNFRASTMLTLAQMRDKEATAKSGLASSVMDYLAPNIAVPGEPQGHYFTPTIGPYDYLAIEYGYKPVAKDDAKALKAVAQRTAEPGLAYATDEDVYYRGLDPRAQIWDLGEPLEFSQHQARLMIKGLPGMAERMVAQGEGWQRAAEGFMTLVGGYLRGAQRACSIIGGYHLARDHRGDPGAADPLAPVPFAQQREALRFLTTQVLADNVVQFDPAMLRKLAPSHWSDAFDDSPGFDTNLIQTNIQTFVVRTLLGGPTLMALQGQANLVAPAATGADAPITADELFNTVTGCVFRELPKAGVAVRPAPIGTVARRVQRDYVRQLAGKAVGRKDLMRVLIFVFESPTPSDARSLARQHLKRIHTGITQQLAQGRGALDGVTVAHYEALLDQIDGALRGQVQVDLD